jgi:H+/Cl- antiporter ClcA
MISWKALFIVGSSYILGITAFALALTTDYLWLLPAMGAGLMSVYTANELRRIDTIHSNLKRNLGKLIK